MDLERLSSIPARSPRRFGNKRNGSKVNVGLVGLGYWGPNLLRALFELEDVEVSYICDLDSERLERFGRRYPSARPTRDFENLLADPNVDAVVIATPVFTHFGLASRALQAGKHVFVEKPLASSSAEAGELIELADQMDRALMCGHTFLYSPAVRAVKEIIRSGDLGEIYFISSSRVNLGLHQRDVSVVWDLGPHDFSILLYWMDEMPEWVGAVGRDSIVKGIPDVAFIDLGLPSGTLSHIELSWLAPSKLRRTVIVGSQKMVVYDDSSSEPVRVFDSGVGISYDDPETFGQYQLSYRTGDILSPKLATTEPIISELTDFVNGVREGRSPEDNPTLARNVVRLIEAAEASMEERGVPVSIESPVAQPYR
jgi:predicted dehydrogenase